MEMVDTLRRTEKVDLVICLSHSGLSSDPKHSEDELLAQKVSGIDIIISGHTHTKLSHVLKVNNTLIVQSWEYGKQLGILDVAFEGNSLTLEKYQPVAIADQILGDKVTTQLIQSFKSRIEQQVLTDLDLDFDQVVAHTDYDLDIETQESNLGNLIADSIRWYINQYDSDPTDPQTRVQVSFISNGVIRDPIKRGKTGNIAVSDVFRAIPLGIGFDDPDTMGYALVSFYIYPSELKKAFEILTSIYPLKGSDYFLQFSGARIVYNPNRMIFDRVTHIEIGSEEDGYTPLDYAASNKTLIRAAADIYNSTFLKVVGNFTWHILDIVPKDRQGNPIDDLKPVRVDADPLTAGIQELKEWQGVMAYIRSFADTTGDGVSDIPSKYKGKLNRNVIAASWNPYHLLKGGSKVTWITFSAIVVVLLLGALALRMIINKFLT
jgi:5'-nucleotidase